MSDSRQPAPLASLLRSALADRPEALREAERLLEAEASERRSIERNLKALTETLEQKAEAQSAAARRHAQELAYAKIRLDAILRCAPDAVFTASEDGVIETANPAAARLFGFASFETIGRDLGCFVPLLREGGHLTRGAAALPFAQYETRGVRKNGETFPVQVSVSETHLGREKIIVVFAKDITEQKRIEEALTAGNAQMHEENRSLSRMVMIDPLTEFLNRRGLQQILIHEIHWLQRDGEPLLACLVDLDAFKRVNDLLGHVAGDAVLKEVSRRLRESLRSTDYAARVGGDEFIVLLPQTNRAEALEVAEKARAAIARTVVRSDGEPLRVTASIGVVAMDPDGVSIDEILSEAHQALHRCKTSGKNRVVGAWDYPAGLLPAPEAAAAREKPCRVPFEKSAHSIRRLSDEQVAGREVFIRCADRVSRLPDDFFLSLLEAGPAPLPLVRTYVALSPFTLTRIPLARLVEPLPPEVRGNCYIEISQQKILGDPSYLIPPVRRLKEMGLRVAMDETGFGRTSLESLILLAPDLLRIDPKDVRGIARSPGRQRSLARLVRTAEALEAEVVADGIENREDLHALREAGVRYGHGPLWDEPARLPASARPGTARAMGAS